MSHSGIVALFLFLDNPLPDGFTLKHPYCMAYFLYVSYFIPSIVAASVAEVVVFEASITLVFQLSIFYHSS